MRVLLSAFQCAPGLGSEPGTGWHWATTLPRLGHEVTVLTSSSQRERILSVGPQSADFRFVDDPVSSLRGLSPRFQIYDIYRRWQDAALRHIAANAQQYDVAHHVTWASLHLGSQLWKLPVPLVYGPIGGGQTAPASYWRFFGREWATETLRTAATGTLLKLNSRSRETLRHSAVTLVCKSATEAAAKRLGATDIRFMLADGLRSDSLAEPRPQPPGTPVVFWVGRLLPRKSPVLAVEAFAHLRRAMPARLVVAGDGPLGEQVRANVDRLGLAADVDLLGHVSLTELRQLYDSASVLLFTSLRESFGAPFLEALGRGLPAVALDLHGIADADVGNAAVKVALPPDPRDLAGHVGAALQTILSDGEWESRSAAAVKWASGWVWESKAATATRIYQEVAGVRD
jgi:glycosyltransferase involved in cell wall biosynthesis